jgi:aldose 1-epimerase
LEEQRIGRIYLNLVKGWFGSVWDTLFPRGLRRSRWLPIFVIALVVALPIVAWRLHRLGRFGYLKREIQGVPQGTPQVGPQPGGMDPIVLIREQTPGSNIPQFRSVTLLPGLGMEVLQITAFVPDKGEVDLLAAPTLDELAYGKTPMRTGANDRWGALELPWSGLLTGVLTPVGSALRTTWHGKTIEAPTDTPARSTAEGGMLVTLSADSVHSNPAGRPTTVSAGFKDVDFDQHWTSKTDVSVSVTLSASTIDLTVTAKNVGDQPEPMGIGWHPRFIIPSGQRSSAEVRMPSGDQLEIADRVKGTPSGKFTAPSALLARFQGHPGVVGVESIDEAMVHPRPGVMDSGIVLEVRDPASAFGLRMKALSDSIRELRMTSAAGSNYVSLGTQTNLDDPFGKEWNGAEPPIATLAPGQSAEWKIQLEIFGVSGHGTAPR